MSNFSFNIESFQKVLTMRGGLQQPNRYSVYISQPQAGEMDSETAKDILTQKIRAELLAELTGGKPKKAKQN